MRGIIDAALRRQRTAVLAAVVVGASWGVVAGWARAVGGPAVLLTLPPLFLIMGAAVRDLRLPFSTGGLRVNERERRFLAPPRAGIAFPVLSVGFLTYQAVEWGRRADGRALPTVLAGFFALAGAAFAIGLWRRVPSLELTPDGIVIRRMERRIDVPWTALDPARRVGAPGVLGALRLPVHRPELVRGGGWGRGAPAIALRELDVSPALLAAAIEHYANHPEHRPAIGIDEEYGRLLQALSGGR